jgi:hypothetical protein
MIGKGVKAGASMVCAVVFAFLFSVPAPAQTKDLSEKSVQVLMRYAWALTPPKFTTPDGKTIEVDKSKPKDVIVSVDTAREVIKVARLSAFAQICNLAEEQRANYQTMMRREQVKKTWTDQQLLYISQLHLFTVMTLTGKVQIVEKAGDKQVVVQDTKTAPVASCNNTERDRVKAQITAYISAPPPEAGAKKGSPLKTGSTPKK